MTLSRLTRELYAGFLRDAKAQGLEFLRFADFLPGAPRPTSRFALLRHDIDFAPAYSLELAELEHEAGVAATYFVLVDGQFYNPLDREVIDRIRRIHALGHEVGLHFAVGNVAHADLGEEVAFRIRILSEIVGAPVRSYSQHDPVNAGFAKLRLPQGHEPCVDAYQLVRDLDLLYVSDSAMMWRDHTFATALREERNLCLLAHAHSWLHPEDDYVAMIRQFESYEAQGVADRFDGFVDGLTDYYRRRAEEGA